MTGLLMAVVLVGLVIWRRRRRRRYVRETTPLAGVDTGVRSPYRTPYGRYTRPRRGF